MNVRTPMHSDLNEGLRLNRSAAAKSSPAIVINSDDSNGKVEVVADSRYKRNIDVITTDSCNGDYLPVVKASSVAASQIKSKRKPDDFVEMEERFYLDQDVCQCKRQMIGFLPPSPPLLCRTPNGTATCKTNGAFPSLVDKSTAPCLPLLEKKFYNSRPKACKVIDPTTRVIHKWEIIKDAVSIINELVTINNGKCAWYPPFELDSAFTGPTMRVIYDESKGNPWRFPDDFNQKEHDCARISARLGIARFRCTTMADRSDSAVFITEDGDLPKSQSDRYGSTGKGAYKSWCWSASINCWISEVVPRVLATSDQWPSCRFLDLIEVLTYVLSRRFGFIWSPTFFNAVLVDRKDESNRDKRTKVVIRELLAYEKSKEEDSPKYNLSKGDLLPEDLAYIEGGAAKKQQGLTREPFRKHLHPSRLQAASSASYKGISMKQNENITQADRNDLEASSTLRENLLLKDEHVDPIIRKMVAMMKPMIGNKARRSISFYWTGDISELEGEDFEYEIKMSLQGIPVYLYKLHRFAQAQKLTLEFADVVHCASALTTLPVWIHKTKESHDISLQWIRPSVLPKMLRTLSLAPPQPVISVEELHAKLEQNGHTMDNLSIVRESVGQDMRIEADTWKETMQVLQDAKLFEGEFGRFVLSGHTPAILWCKQCNAPGHAVCSAKVQRKKCTYCPALSDAIPKLLRCKNCKTSSDESGIPINCKDCNTFPVVLTAHTIKSVVDEAKAHGNSMTACVVRRLLQFYNEQLWAQAIRQAIAGEGIYSMSEKGILFRMEELGGSHLEVYGGTREVAPLTWSPL